MGTSTMSGHYVCHLKKEGRWVELGETHKDEQMFSLTHASYRAGCVFMADKTRVLLPCMHFPPKKLRFLQIVDVVSWFWFWWGVCWNVPSALLCLFQISVHLAASVLYLDLFIWASPNFLSFTISRNQSNYGLILVLLVLWCWSWLWFWYGPIIWHWESLIFLHLIPLHVPLRFQFLTLLVNLLVLFLWSFVFVV